MSRTTPRKRELPPEAATRPDPEVRLAGIEGALDFPAVFGRRGSVELEVGFGKGRFLLTEAAARPETLFLGVEYALPYMRLVRFRTLLEGLANVRVVHANARELLATRIAAGSVSGVHILFPDPWPKRGHHGRRLVTPELLESVASALEPGGTLNIATDHEDYATWIARAADQVPVLVPAPTFALGGDLAPRTHFATKFAPRVPCFHARTWTRAR